MTQRPIIFLDSGVGGLSTMAEAKALLPKEDMVYFADTANAPYGDKTEEAVRQAVQEKVQELLALDPKAVVLACNTATSAGVKQLRDCLDIPVIGMEPALKPALAAGGVPLVLGTALTVRAEKWQELLKRFAADRQVVVLPCPGLMQLVEQEVEQQRQEEYLRRLLDPYQEQEGGIVLGCTHYIFLRPLLERLYPQKRLFDGNQGVARRLKTLLQQADQLADAGGELAFYCSEQGAAKADAFLQKAQRFYQRHQAFLNK